MHYCNEHSLLGLIYPTNTLVYWFFIFKHGFIIKYTKYTKQKSLKGSVEDFSILFFIHFFIRQYWYIFYSNYHQEYCRPGHARLQPFAIMIL